MSSDIEDDLNTDKEDDLSGDTEDDSDADSEDDFDPSLDFSEIGDNDFDPSLDFSKIDDNAFDPSLDFSKIDDNAFDPSLDFSKIGDNDFDPSLDFNENEGKLGQNELGKELEPNQPVSNESNTEVSSEQFGPNESESSEEKEEFNPNSPDGEIDNFEQEGYSEGFYGNFNAESMNTVLLSENLIYAALKEYIEFMVENETETEVQGEQVEVDNSKEEISELEEFLNEERERIRLEQQQAELDEGFESEPSANEEEIEKVVDQEQEIGIQENISEEMVPNNEEEVENLEMKLEDELQSILPNEGIESGKIEEIEEKNEEQQPLGIEENIEGREKEFKVDDGKYEQRQSETQIEEKHDIESETIAHEKELELIKEEQEEKEVHDEFIKEGEQGQIIQEFEVIQEISSNETEVLVNEQQEELERDHISPYKEKLREIKEYKDSQQELEEILEQTKKIEQESLIEVEYNQESGKDPIYANEEIIESKQWLEQKKESEEKQEHLPIQKEVSEVVIEGIEQESDEGINPKLQPLLKEIIENYNFLENLTTRFKELYESAQNKQISKAEKIELNLLINSLKKVGPTKFMLFANIKAIKCYAIKEGFSDKANLNHALNHFFTKFLQKNLIFKVLIENQTVKPIAHEEKGLSTKAWGALRKLVWTEIDKYIKGRINIIKELAIEEYNLLTKHILNKLNNTLQLSKQRLSKERINLLKKAVITIYLMNLENSPSQAEIRRISGFKSNYHIRSIIEHLKMDIPSSSLQKSYIDRKSSKIRSSEWNNLRDRISEEILRFTKKNKKLLMVIPAFQKDNRDFHLLMIKEIFTFLKNNTGSLNNLDINQLKKIPLLIYNTIKDKFTNRNIYREDDFIENISNLYGFIYLGRNLTHKKVYVGQTTLTIEEEWGDILKGGKAIRKKRQENPNMKISARYIHNAIAKYGLDVWELKLIDIAYKKSELDDKEIYYVKFYDSMNPAKGYNLTTGGRTGGRLSPATKKKVSESVQNVWNSPGYRERLGKAQSKSWESEERREKNIKGLLKSWENEERRQQASEQAFKRWEDEEISEKMKLGLSMSAKKKWQNPTEAMLKNLQNLHQKTRKEIVNIKEFLIDIKNTKEQREFWQGDLFEKYGIKSHMTLNKRIKENLGGFGINNHGEAHRFFYDRSLDEVMKYLDNPKGYNIFRDPFTKHFFIDVRNSKKGVDLHKKYRVWHKNGLITKIKRIVGKFGINNYTSLKMFLQDKGINQSLKYFENLE